MPSLSESARTTVAAAALLVLGAAAGCSDPVSSDRPNADGPLHVVCTTGMVADLVRNVGGDRVQIRTLMGAGVDPHLYQPRPSDTEALESADVIFFSGLHLEGKLAGLLDRMAARKPVFAVADGIPLDRILKSGEFPDPHVWMDVELWRCGLDVVESRLAELRPQWNGEFQRRAADYRRELDALHRECLDAVKTVPAPQRVLVTAHDAFQYFGRAYGVEVRAIQGISTESEASVQQINALVDFLVERKIRAVFVESSVSERNVEALREGCRSRGHKVRIGGDLYSDAMGDEGTPEGTYPGMIRHNVRTIVSALRADAM